jgi:hypothetical protein
MSRTRPGRCEADRVSKAKEVYRQQRSRDIDLQRKAIPAFAQAGLELLCTFAKSPPHSNIMTVQERMAKMRTLRRPAILESVSQTPIRAPMKDTIELTKLRLRSAERNVLHVHSLRVGVCESRLGKQSRQEVCRQSTCRTSSLTASKTVAAELARDGNEACHHEAVARSSRAKD